MLAEVETLVRIFEKTVVDASSEPPSLNKLAVVLYSNVDVRIVLIVLIVVFNLGAAVVLSIAGKVEDIAVVRMLVVTLPSPIVEV